MSEQMRLVELLSPLSFAGDLGRGQTMGHVLRTCRITMAAAEHMALSKDELRDMYFTALLVHAGCTAGASEFAAFLAGDELRAQKDFCLCDPNNLKELFGWLGRNTAPGKPLPAKTLRMLQLLASGEKAFQEIDHGCSEVGSRIASRLSMSDETQKSLYNVCETWNGKGPHHLRGGDIPLPSRLVNAAMITEVFFSERGVTAAKEAALARSGKLFDPEIAQVVGRLCDNSAFWEAMSNQDSWDAVLELEPEPVSYVGEDMLDAVALALADIVDLKSNATTIHSRQAAELAESMARRLHLSAAEVALTRRAALVHDVGLVAVPSFLLANSSTWSATDFEKYRLHPYYTERILSRCLPLRDAGLVAGAHHECLDGSGFHRGSRDSELSVPARILGVVSRFQERSEGVEADALTGVLAGLRQEPTLDGECIEVLEAELGNLPVGPSRPQGLPAGLTDRELEVLQLLATGLNVKRIAEHLVISSHTARHHVESIYSKAGVASRAGAVLFAVDNNLIRPGSALPPAIR